MRWLLAKDLTLLRRSPVVTVLLVLYPIAIAVLIGFALSGGPDKPRVAFLGQVPEGTPLNVGGESFDTVGARDELCQRIQCVDVSSEAQARDLVESGDVLAALILPPDLVTDLQSLAGLNPQQPTVKVLVNEENPVKGQLVDDTITSLLAQANLKVSQQIADVSTTYLGILLNGGSLSFLGQDFSILGLKHARNQLEELRPVVPARDREQLDAVIRFATLAAQNLDEAEPLLRSVAQPIQVDKEVVTAGSTSLDVYAISVAATITLMFVTVLLVAGSLALEREENAFGRLVRNLISKTALLAEKLVLGIVASLVVTLLMLAGLEAFVNLDWARFALWIPAILAGGAGFAAFGAAIGVAAREVRASSLLAFMVSLPVAFLSLVPSGTVSKTAYDAIGVVTALFPFDPALRALEGALDSAGPSLLVAIGHLAILTVAYGAMARFAMRRFA